MELDIVMLVDKFAYFVYLCFCLAVENLEDNQANESVSNLSTTCSCNETNEVIMNLNESENHCGRFLI